mmetsp:Transcript_22082/g.34611  ORF Transcript_22082/g.34611 Transcript_22082/m.34611 type:complete len:563 (+) Transcript_22082:418-2106(+)
MMAGKGLFKAVGFLLVAFDLTSANMVASEASWNQHAQIRWHGEQSEGSRIRELSCFVAPLQQQQLSYKKIEIAAAPCLRGGGFEDVQGPEVQEESDLEQFEQLAGNWIDRMSLAPALSSPRAASIIDPVWMRRSQLAGALLYHDVRLLEAPSKDAKHASSQNRPNRRRQSASEQSSRSSSRQMDQSLQAMIAQEKMMDVHRISSMPELMIRPRLKIHARSSYSDPYSSSCDSDSVQELIQSSREKAWASAQRAQWVESCLRTSARALDPPSWSRSQLQALDEPRRSRSRSRSSQFETIVRTEGCVRFQTTETTRVEVITEENRTYRRSRSRKQVRVRVSKSVSSETSVKRGRAERTRSNSQPATAAENRARIADIVQDNYSDLCKGETTEYGEQMPVNISAILSWINVPLVVQRTRNILRDQYPELQSNSQQSFKAVSEVGISTQESGPKNFQQDSAAEDASNAMSCFGFHGNQVHWDRNSAGRLSFGGGASRDAKEESKANPIICASESYGESADETSLFPASDSEIEEAAKRETCRIPRWAQLASVALAGCFYSPLLLIP